MKKAVANQDKSKRAKKPSVVVAQPQVPAEPPLAPLPLSAISIAKRPPIEISKWSHNGHLSQIYSAGVEFAFASADNRQCHQFVFCKDFLHDAVWAMVNQKPVSIFGFSYAPGTNPSLDMSRTRLIIAHARRSSSFNTELEGVEDLLNQAEIALKLKRTRIFPITGLGDKYEDSAGLLVGSGMWLTASPLVSLYSLLARVGLVHSPGTDFMMTLESVAENVVNPIGKNDTGYLKQAMPVIKKIFKHGYRKFFFIDPVKNYPASLGSGIHSAGGICGTTPSRAVVKYFSKKLAAVDATPGIDE